MFISNNNYAKLLNFDFAETVGVDTLTHQQNGNLKIIYKNNQEITYKSKYFRNHTMAIYIAKTGLH